MRILVVDGQGGGLGRTLIEKLKAMGLDAEIIGVGTNSIAASAMHKAGADAVATGENAVIYNAHRAHIITGGIGIMGANSMLGEISPAMAGAISQSDAVKVLVPMSRCNIRVAGVADSPMPLRIDSAVAEIRALAVDHPASQ